MISAAMASNDRLEIEEKGETKVEIIEVYKNSPQPSSVADLFRHRQSDPGKNAHKLAHLEMSVKSWPDAPRAPEKHCLRNGKPNQWRDWPSSGDFGYIGKIENSGSLMQADLFWQKLES